MYVPRLTTPGRPSSSRHTRPRSGSSRCSPSDHCPTYDVGSSYIVVDTGPWILGRKVLLPAGVIQEIDLDNRKVEVRLTKGQIKNSPEIDVDAEDYRSDAYRERVAEYYSILEDRCVPMAYSVNANTLENVDVSAQWPIYRGWIGVGRANYSLMDRRIAEGLAGFEYNGGCWVLRVVTSTVAVGKGDSSRSIYVQLELNGVARVGSNPLDVLRQNIAGYTKINEPQANGLPASRW